MAEQVINLTSEDLEFLRTPPTSRGLRKSVLRMQLLRMAMRGINIKEAAMALDISPDQVAVHYRDPDFQKEVIRRVSGAFQDPDSEFVDQKKTLLEKVNDQAEKSFDRLVQILDQRLLAPKDEVRVHQDFLDRAKDTSKIERREVLIDHQALANAAKVASEMDRGNGKVVDIRKLA